MEHHDSKGASPKTFYTDQMEKISSVCKHIYIYACMFTSNWLLGSLIYVCIDYSQMCVLFSPHDYFLTLFMIFTKKSRIRIKKRAEYSRNAQKGPKLSSCSNGPCVWSAAWLLKPHNSTATTPATLWWYCSVQPHEYNPIPCSY